MSITCHTNFFDLYYKICFIQNHIFAVLHILNATTPKYYACTAEQLY